MNKHLPYIAGILAIILFGGLLGKITKKDGPETETETGTAEHKAAETQKGTDSDKPFSISVRKSRQAAERAAPDSSDALPKAVAHERAASTAGVRSDVATDATTHYEDDDDPTALPPLEIYNLDELRDFLQETLTLTDKNDRRRALRQIAQYLTNEDSSVAKEIFASIEEFDDQKTFALMYTRSLAVVDPYSAAQWSQDTPFRIQRDLIPRILKEWSSSDIQAAADWVTQMKDQRLIASASKSIANEWKKADPELAGAWAAKMAAKNIRNLSLNETIGKLWAEVDPGAAFEWASKFSDIRFRDKAMMSIVGTLAENDPIAAADWAHKFPDTQSRAKAVSAAYQQWSKQDPYAAAASLSDIDNGKVMNEAVKSIAKGWVAKDAAEAAKWVESLPGGDSQHWGMVALSQEWARKDPQKAAAWAVGLPNSSMMTKATTIVASSWSSHDPRGAADWVSMFPDGSLKRNSLTSTTHQWALKNPDAASQWIDNLASGDSGNYDYLYRDVSRVWSRKDPQAAERWILESSLSDSEKDKLLNRLNL